MKISDILLTQKIFPIVVSPEAINYEDLRRKYFLFKLNDYFGLPPTSMLNERGFNSLFLYISNVSQGIIDLAYSLEEFERKYFRSSEITVGVIKETRSFFYPIYNDDVFVIKPELWDVLYQSLQYLYKEVLYNGLQLYFSYLFTKITKLMFVAISQTLCRAEEEEEVRSFFEKIRKRVQKKISPTENEDLEKYLLNLESDVFVINDEVLPNKTSSLSFYEAYVYAYNNRTIKELKVEELYSNFYKEFELLYKRKILEVFSNESPFYQNFLTIIGSVELTDEYLKQITT